MSGVSRSGFTVSGSAFRVHGFGFGFGFCIQGFKFSVSRSGYGVSQAVVSRFWVSQSGLTCSGFRGPMFQVRGLWWQGFEFGVSRSRVSGFGVWGFRFRGFAVWISALGVSVSGPEFRVSISR